MKETYLPAILASYAKDADVLAAMVGNYQSNTQNIRGKVQLGSAWWFCDHKRGMERQMNALAAPYTNMKFMPTGGINTNNLESYLNCNKIVACGGSWMVKGDLIKAGEFDKIKDLTQEAVALAKSLRK